MYAIVASQSKPITSGNEVPLDATNAVPVKKDFIQRLDPTKQVSRTAQQIWAQSKFQKSHFARKAADMIKHGYAGWCRVTGYKMISYVI